MKLQPDRIEGVNAISGLIPGAVSVNGIVHRQSILVPWQGEVTAWDVASFEALTPEHFQAIAEQGPELVIFGSGDRLRFPAGALMRPLIERRIGLETMDTAAACRTYNVLVSEGRRALVALLLGGGLTEGEPVRPYPYNQRLRLPRRNSPRILHDASPQQTPPGI